MDTDSFIASIKTQDIYSDIAKHVETRLNTSNYKLDRQLCKGKNKKVIGLMKDQLARWENNERVFRIKSKNVYLFNR